MKVRPETVAYLHPPLAAMSPRRRDKRAHQAGELRGDSGDVNFFEIGVLFTDVRGFTSMAETMSPNDVAALFEGQARG
jgi:class 3 adenylate cyclase